MRLPRVCINLLSVLAIAASVMLAGPGVSAPGFTASAVPVPFGNVPLADGRWQQFESVGHAHWIKTRWEVSRGNWTPWIDSEYPPTSAGIGEIHGGQVRSISFYIVFTDGGGTWLRKKVSTDPNGGWTSFTAFTPKCPFC
jgi:hypothetical protein